ncbi:cell division protein FtsQ [Sphingomonas sp. Leaf231]|uniref:cell division protein FtsQ/DivIB n=1 Tax=Sphingomonas sp. Leaf231 TaxID=1736301 RepID=UPI0006FADED5|nr:cell division protein FtsQ/DivIB [Sphingomonas sp. Leaf231]KQN92948.1 cell division protein FtsQ [Sphingomonas sp. Leaf231]
MSRTIKRGASPPPRRPAGRRRVPKASLGDRLIAKLPIGEDTLRKAVTWTVLGGVAIASVFVANLLGVPQAIGAGVAEAAGRAGLRVEQVDITGLKRMDRETVYAIALEDQSSRAMLRVDLERVRDRLLAYGWIADAYVARRLPDRLVIHITEREPAAIWQDHGQLTLIDATGRLLAPVSAARMPDLPLVIGPGANEQEPGYQALLAAAPALRPRIRAATWVGNRRWDLTFTTGETLALPQDGAPQALIKFAQMDGADPLLGKGWLRFDLRDPARMFARRAGQDKQQVADDGRNDPPADAAATGTAGGNVTGDDDKITEARAGDALRSGEA